MKHFKEIGFCLLIPCYNNFDGLIASLKTVIYPRGNFLVLVIDDGSKEAVTLERINKAMDVKKPVVVLHHEKNLGITATLNKGLSWIEKNTDAKYIARLDCGDICMAERFEIQVEYMDANPGTGLVGSWCWFEEKETGDKYAYKTPSEHKQIIRAMHLRNVFIHPTVMFRRSLLKEVGYYPTHFKYAEDYAFFWKLIKIKQSFVFDKFLVICELNKGGISYKNNRKQLISRWKIVKTLATGRPLLKAVALARLIFLIVLPKTLALRLKKWKG